MKGAVSMDFRLLTIGDVVSSNGLQFVCRNLRKLKSQYHIDFCIVNGENAANIGINPEQADRLFDAGADIITLQCSDDFRRGTIWKRYVCI